MGLKSSRFGREILLGAYSMPHLGRCHHSGSNPHFHGRKANTVSNAVELIVSIIALIHNEILIVQTSLIGSILSNLLLVLGMCFFFGGLHCEEQNFNVTVAQTASSMLGLAIGSLIIPTALFMTRAGSLRSALFNYHANCDDDTVQILRLVQRVLLHSLGAPVSCCFLYMVATSTFSSERIVGYTMNQVKKHSDDNLS